MILPGDTQTLWNPEDLKLLRKRGYKFVFKRAMQGILSSQYIVGLMYYTGMHLEKDLAEAYNWFFIASNKNHPESCFLLGSMWMKGEIDPGHGDPLLESISLFKKGWDLKYAPCACAFGNIRTNELIKENEKKDASFFSRFKKTISYSVSKISDEECFSSYLFAESKGYLQSYYFLGLHSLRGWGTSISEEKGISFLAKGASFGDKDCCWLLANIYEEKYGFSTETLDMYERSAESGLPEAQHTYGVMLYDGKLQAKDIKQSKIWLHRAAAQNFGPSQSFLSDVYYYGDEDTKIDLVKSYEWGSRAYQRGFMKEKDLFRIKKKMTDEELSMIPNILDKNIEFDKVMEKMLAIPTSG